MDILYSDANVVVCLKPPGVLSTDEPGGMPERLREQLHTRDVRTVHRLDQVVSGLMVYALSGEDASALSRQMRGGGFGKEYLAVIHWRPRPESGTLRDLLLRDPVERKTHVVSERGKGVQEAVLDYSTIASRSGLSLLRIRLQTGRTHQIRAQLSSRGLPLVGDKKYGAFPDECPIALWSCHLAFNHPRTLQPMVFDCLPPCTFPWTLFPEAQPAPPD